MKKLLILNLQLLLFIAAFGQKYTISGYVENVESGEKILGAALYDGDAPSIGTITNTYGYYSITLPARKIKLVSSYIGFASMSIELNLTKDTVINFSLIPSTSIEKIEVYGQKTAAEQTQMSVIDVPIATIKKLPMLLGEIDVLKAIQLLPGVQSGTEGTSGFYVRGGGPDQNLILIDGVPVYNANHLFGFFSIFNADSINTVKLVKGGFPARYGGRLSSVLDIKMKEGNMKKFSGSASIGLISSKFTFEGPIIKDKSSFIISFRRTYIDVLSWPLQKIALAASGESDMKFRAGYYFWDLNSKLNYKLSDKDRIFLSVYNGKDKAYTESEYSWEDTYEEESGGLEWGNITSALRWNHKFAKKLFLNTTATYSNYIFDVGFSEYSRDSYNNSEYDASYDYYSGIEDLALKFDFDYRPDPSHTIKFGGNFINHTFKPGVNAFKIDSHDNSQSKIDTTFGNRPIYANEFYAYAEDEINVFKNLKANIGIHYSGFYVDETFYNSIQPRISARYLVNKNLSVKAAYTQMTQYMHLLTNTTIGLPTDLWLPVTKNVKPQNSTQYAAGIFYSIGHDYDISIEGYYKTMTNLIAYKEGASFFSGMGDDAGNDRSWENEIEIDGAGESYGAEFLFKKNHGKTTGWIGYTLSWAYRQFDNINFGKRYSYSYDRRHDIGIVVVHKFNDKIDIGATWVYGTGNSYTLALERFAGLQNVSPWENYTPLIDNIENRNNYRMPAYHRLDFSVNFNKQKKYGKRIWSVGAYNLYNRKNPFYMDFGYDSHHNRVLKQYSLFPIIPSVSYKYEF